LNIFKSGEITYDFTPSSYELPSGDLRIERSPVTESMLGWRESKDEENEVENKNVLGHDKV